MIITVPYMSALALATVILRPYRTFMEGLINTIVWLTGILASISYHLFSEGKLSSDANKACTYTVVGLTFIVMFAIVVHVMLGIFSRERIAMRAKKIPQVSKPNPDLILDEVIRTHAPEPEIQAVPIEPIKLIPEPLLENQDFISKLQGYFLSMFSTTSEPQSQTLQTSPSVATFSERVSDIDSPRAPRPEDGYALPAQPLSPVSSSIQVAQSVAQGQASALPVSGITRGTTSTVTSNIQATTIAPNMITSAPATIISSAATTAIASQGKITTTPIGHPVANNIIPFDPQPAVVPPQNTTTQK